MSCWPHNLFHSVFYCNVAVHVCVYMHLGVRLHALLWLVCQCCSVPKKLFGNYERSEISFWREISLLVQIYKYFLFFNY
jgi:hypothetical protein